MHPIFRLGLCSFLFCLYSLTPVAAANAPVDAAYSLASEARAVPAASALSCAEGQQAALYLGLDTVELLPVHTLGGLAMGAEIPQRLVPGSYLEVCAGPQVKGWLPVQRVWTYVQAPAREPGRTLPHWERIALDPPADQVWFVALDSRLYRLPRQHTGEASHQPARTMDFELEPAASPHPVFAFTLRPVDHPSPIEEDVHKVEITTYVEPAARQRTHCTLYLPAGTTQTVVPAHCLYNRDAARLPQITGLDLRQGAVSLDAEVALVPMAGQDMTTLKLFNWETAAAEPDSSAGAAVPLHPRDLIPGRDSVVLCGFPAFLQPPFEIGVSVRVMMRGQVTAIDFAYETDFWSIGIQLTGVAVPSVGGMSGSTVFVQREEQLLPVAMVVAGSTYPLYTTAGVYGELSPGSAAVTRIEALGLPPEVLCLAHHAQSIKIETAGRFLYVIDEEVELLFVEEAAIEAFLRQAYPPAEYRELQRLLGIFTAAAGMELRKVGSYRGENFFVIGNDRRAVVYKFVVKPAYGNQGPDYEFDVLRSLRSLAIGPGAP